jgi:hypothetical protein
LSEVSCRETMASGEKKITKIYQKKLLHWINLAQIIDVELRNRVTRMFGRVAQNDGRD